MLGIFPFVLKIGLLLGVAILNISNVASLLAHTSDYADQPYRKLFGGGLVLVVCCLIAYFIVILRP